MAVADRPEWLKLALMAACADPVGGISEQAQLRQVAENLSAPAGENLALTLREILLQRLKLEQLVGALLRPELKLVAYELAVCICNADSAHSDPEHAFLERLRVALALDVRTARSFEREADAITGVPLQGDPSRVPLAAAHPVDEALLDRVVDDSSVLTAALAARAEPLALLATIPLDMKLIYRLGKHYGHELDRGQVRSWMSAIGVEPVSQYVYSCGLLILAGAMDRPRSPLPPSVEAAEVCFARTFALGHVARKFHAHPQDESDLAHLQEGYAQAHREGRRHFESRWKDVMDRARQTAMNDLLTLVKQ